ncbi:uncharacterized protein F4812DRAFT_98852 [Daldinia caldariorum]|uniref:uncharacterized protein n=1 Tax=Daldinia caldariorum TaxID=326644 RepID=UPI0020088396|nr:uncharacterized protein F4812DRAFT_98852 [Daldinia caldariorum]KAI1466158.1 hypothetical protein F4812DRAFT_98852 [Daldinia caldariorum]
MAPISPHAPFTWGLNGNLVRTPDSLVWGATRAIDLVSGVRFSWDNSQNKAFIDFLRAFGPNYKSTNFELLLFRLDLDGYEDIRNKNGESVHRLIMEKVLRKLKSTADKMAQNGLIESYKTLVNDANLTRSNPMNYNKSKIFDFRQNAILSGREGEAKSSISSFSSPKLQTSIRSTPSNHSPFLSMSDPNVPKGPEAASVSSSPSVSSITTQFKSSEGSPTEAQHSYSQEQSSSARDQENEDPFETAGLSLVILIRRLAKFRYALDDAESVFLKLPMSKERERWVKGLFARMGDTHSSIQYDTTDLQEYITEE